MAGQVFRFKDRQAEAAERHMVELRDGKHYRMRTGVRDQPGESAVRIHELAEIVRNKTQGMTIDELQAQLENGNIAAADTRLLWDSMVELVRICFFEDVTDEVIAMHNADDFRAIIDQYFLLWSPQQGAIQTTELEASPILG